MNDWAYICHPFSTYGNLEENLKRQSEILEMYKGGHLFVPISPILLFSGVFSPDPDDHPLVMESCLRLLDSCDQIHLHGRWQDSLGCNIEVVHAINTGKLIMESCDGRLKVVDAASARVQLRRIEPE